MHTYLRKLPLAAAVLAVGALALPAVAHADTHVWNYKSYKKGASGSSVSSRFVAGTLELEEDGGQATIVIAAEKAGSCLGGTVPVTVTRTDAQTVIDAPPRLPGCDHYRFVIRNDGGGVRERKRGEQWSASSNDFDLTPKK